MGVFFPSEVGNIAHLSGVGVGMVLGLISRSTYKEEKVNKEKLIIPEDYMRIWEDKYMKR